MGERGTWRYLRSLVEFIYLRHLDVALPRAAQLRPRQTALFFSERATDPASTPL